MAIKNYVKKSVIPLQVKPGKLEKNIDNYDAIKVAYVYEKDGRKLETLIKSKHYKNDKEFNFYKSFEAKVARNLAQDQYDEALNYLTIKKILGSDELKGIASKRPAAESRSDQLQKIRQIMAENLGKQQDFSLSHRTFVSTIRREYQEEHLENLKQEKKKIFKN